jgi:hypothetical protein
MKDSAPVVGVLLEERSIETVGMAESIDVGNGSSFAEHLDDGVAWNEVNEKKDDRDDNPEDRKCKQDAAEGSPVVASVGLRRWFGRNAGVPRLRAARFARNDSVLFRF